MPGRTKKKKLSKRNVTIRRQRILKIDLDKMTSKQIAYYEDSLDVLNRMRHGESLAQASKQVGISTRTVKGYVGSALIFHNHRWSAKKSDRLLRKIRIYENGKQTWITVRGIKQARIVGQYHSAVGRLADNESSLLPFKKIKIKDAKGKVHRLETDPVKVFSILEQQEDMEFYTIYGRN
ncbi:MAG: hypothetical protein KGI33_08010 [Thaumarchaeota archaeon]|nr:hypothetical protein [Nitrososphaerota archaeon]